MSHSCIELVMACNVYWWNGHIYSFSGSSKGLRHRLENFQVGGHLGLNGVGYSNSCGCAWTQSSLSHALPQPIKTEQTRTLPKGVYILPLTASPCPPPLTSKKQNSSCSRLEEESLAWVTDTSENLSQDQLFQWRLRARISLDQKWASLSCLGKEVRRLRTHEDEN